MQADGFAWWKARLQHLLNLVDIVRVTHFLGALTPTGKYPPANPRPWPGGVQAQAKRCLTQLLATPSESQAGDPSEALPIIAEDLGEITPAVVALRQACGFPGMRVLQFAFGDMPANPYLPHNYDAQTVAYTGTHDNNTTVGWWQAASPAEQEAARRYLGPQVDTEIHWAMVQALSQSVACTVIIPFQDVLGLDGSHRMNTPGQAQDCWQWRFDWRTIGDEPGHGLAALTRAHGRNPNLNTKP